MNNLHKSIRTLGISKGNMNMEGVLREATISMKGLWKERGFSTTAILTLAVCLGANVAIFTIVNSVLLRPLPVPKSERIVFISNQYPGAGVREIWSVGVPDYLDRRRQMTNVFEEEAMFRSEDQTVDVNGTPERVKGMRITPSMFHLRLVIDSPKPTESLAMNRKSF